MNTKPILAYDCATTGASVALRVDGRTQTRRIGQTTQAAELVPVIDALLREHGVGYKDLSCIVTTTGPGSFTGMRIGLAALHGLVLVADMPIKLLTTLEAVAWQVAREKNTERFIVSLRAGKGEVYAQAFVLRHGAPTPENDILLLAETKNDWALPHFGALTPDAGILCDIAAQLPTATLAQALPVYIRPPDAVVPTGYAWLQAN